MVNNFKSILLPSCCLIIKCYYHHTHRRYNPNRLGSYGDNNRHVAPESTVSSGEEDNEVDLMDLTDMVQLTGTVPYPTLTLWLTVTLNTPRAFHASVLRSVGAMHISTSAPALLPSYPMTRCVDTLMHVYTCCWLYIHMLLAVHTHVVSAPWMYVCTILHTHAAPHGTYVDMLVQYGTWRGHACTVWYVVDMLVQYGTWRGHACTVWYVVDMRVQYGTWRGHGSVLAWSWQHALPRPY